MFSVSVTQVHTIVLRGKTKIMSFCIQVEHGDDTWYVFQTEEQISKLTASLIQPIIEGSLFKKSGSIAPTWSKRYFKFIGRTLYYSRNLETGFDITVVSTKKIDLTDAKVVPTNDVQAHAGTNGSTEFKNMKGMFEIHKADGEIIYLKADSNGELVKWVNALRGESENHKRSKSAPQLVTIARPTSPLMRSAPPSPPSPPAPLQQPTSLRSQPSSPVPLRRLTKREKSISFRAIFSHNGADDDPNLKQARLNSLLQTLCASNPDSDVLRASLLVNAYPGEEYPQMRMMLDAIKENNLSLIERLHEQYGVALNFVYKGNSFFVEAIKSGNMGIVKFIKVTHEDILATEPESSLEELLYKKDIYDSTPFHYACATSLPLACLLASFGSIQMFVDGFGAWTPLHHLAQHSKAVILEQVDYLDRLVGLMLPYCNSQDLAGHTPLHICAKQNNVQMALLLLQKGVKLDKVTLLNKNFLHLLAHNSSSKAHDMMYQVLQYMFKAVISQADCDLQMKLLETRDHEGKTAIQHAHDRNALSPHIDYLNEHYLELENFKFSLIFADILYQCSQKSIPDIKNTNSFKMLIELICSACALSDYHNDVEKLIRRTLDLIRRTQNSLLDVDILEKERLEFMEEVLRGIYPFVHSLFLKKRAPVDSILTRNLTIYNQQVTYAGIGITEAFLEKVRVKVRVVETQRRGMRKSSNPNSEGEQLLFKRGLDIQAILAEIPELFRPRDKLNCLREIFDIFECEGADEQVPLLSYLMVRSCKLSIQWAAEIDYIMTISPDENCLLLDRLQHFFLTSWMQLKNGIMQVEEVTTIESLTIADIKSLWTCIKKTPTGQADISLLHAFFFAGAHNTTDTNFIELDGCFSSALLANGYMLQVVDRLGLTIVPTNKGTTEIVYAEFVDASLLARIASSFVEVLQDGRS